MSAARRGFIVFAVAVLFLVGALMADYFWISPDAPAAPSIAAIGGPFSLIDQNGVARHDTDFRGKLMLVYFGYAFCPDACPTTLLTIGQTMDQLGTAADKVQPLFLTVDPARDTVQELKLYSSNFSPRILMLTGTPDQTAAAAKKYRVYYRKVDQPGGGKDDYLIDHTSLIYLMDRDGHYLTSFSMDATAAQMAERIKRYL